MCVRLILDGYLTRLSALQIDGEAKVATFQGGTWLCTHARQAKSRSHAGTDDCHPILRSHGLAFSSLGSISNQSLAGTISTATHGYGYSHGCISSAVRHLVLVLANGSVVRCSRTEDPDLFFASLCGLGSTGIIVEVGIQCEEDYRLEEETFGMEFENLLDAIVGPDGTTDTGIFGSAEHVRAYLYPQVMKTRVQRANRTKRVRTLPPVFPPVDF
jgi:FAD/FMN-containing dehydrogenase